MTKNWISVTFLISGYLKLPYLRHHGFTMLQKPDRSLRLPHAEQRIRNMADARSKLVDRFKGQQNIVTDRADLPHDGGPVENAPGTSASRPHRRNR